MESDDAGGDQAPVFADQLRRAIAGSGLPLTEVRRRLTARGVHVGLATLSQWRSGDRVPRSPSSLRVVGALEDVLGLAPNRLWDLVSVPLPSGRPVGRSRMDDLGGAPPALFSALAELDLLGPPELDDVAAQVTVEVGADRCVSTITTLQVMRAHVSGARVMPVFLVLDEPIERFPRIHAVSGCTVGRRAERLDDGVAVVELVLDAPLARNDTALVEFSTAVEPYAVGDSDFYAHAITGRAAQVVVTARFAPGHAAHAGEAFRTDRDGTEIEQVARSVPAGLHTIAHDFGPGQVGLRWWWT